MLESALVYRSGKTELSRFEHNALLRVLSTIFKLLLGTEAPVDMPSRVSFCMGCSKHYQLHFKT